MFASRALPAIPNWYHRPSFRYLLLRRESRTCLGLGKTMARILIVDDRPPSRELERIMLESFGYEVVEAGSGREAMVAALQAVPDLVLLDLHMPWLDGFATLAEFRREPMASTPIVALTASAMQGDDARALEAGFSGYITKPVSRYGCAPRCLVFSMLPP